MNKQFNHQVSLAFAFIAILIELSGMDKVNNPYNFLIALILATLFYYFVARLSVWLIESLLERFGK